MLYAGGFSRSPRWLKIVSRWIDVAADDVDDAFLDAVHGIEARKHWAQRITPEIKIGSDGYDETSTKQRSACRRICSEEWGQLSEVRLRGFAASARQPSPSCSFACG